MTPRVLLFLFAMLVGGGHLRGQSLSEAIALQYQKPDSAIAMCRAMLGQPGLDQTQRSNIFEVIGIAHQVKGRFSEAFTAHAEALEIRQQIDWPSGIGHSENNLGLALREMGDMLGAMEHSLNGLKVAEEHADSVLLVRIYGNIGTLYEKQSDFQRALEYYSKSLDILEHNEDPQILGNTLNNIAMIYSKQGEMEKAENFWNRTIHVRELMGDEQGLALAYNNMGFLFFAEQGDLKTADSLYLLALPIYEKLGNGRGQAMVLGSMGGSSLGQGRVKEAISQCQRSYDLAKEHGTLDYLTNACSCLAEAYRSRGDHREANVHLRRYIHLSDGQRQSDDGRKAALMEQRYNHDRERMQLEIARQRERIIAAEEIKRQQLLRNMSVALGMMGLLLFFILFNSYRKKQQANEELENKNMEIVRQKEEISEKSQEITDSIRYAKRLQDARLPRPEVFDNALGAWHVIYIPKDIVSGDFYWTEEVDGHLLLAVADCTGHGVPGAMVSMVGIQGLNQAALGKRLTSPAAILEHLRLHVEEAFEKSGTEIKDGMDITLCCIAPDRKSLTFAGANNPLYQISSQPEMDGARLRERTDTLHIHEWKADRRSIGGYFHTKSFTEHHVTIHPGDTFMMASDGFADQFGGPDQKKMGTARFRKTALHAIGAGDMTVLDNAFHQWKGGHWQVDDVSVMVFRV